MRGATRHLVMANCNDSTKCQRNHQGKPRHACIRCVRKVDSHPRYSPEKPVDNPSQKHRNDTKTHDNRHSMRDSGDVLVAGVGFEPTTFGL
jgi:hypothetical protein